MGRFDPTGPIEDPSLEHSVALLEWGVLQGALGPSDGSAGAMSNVPSALGVLRHCDLYCSMPAEIEDAFAVLERHVMRDGQLYPVALSTLPFLLAIVGRRSIVSGHVAELIARYLTCANTLDEPLANQLRELIADHASELMRWLGRHDRALGALAIHVPGLREAFVAAVEGAERVAPEILLALVELDLPSAPGDTRVIARDLLEHSDVELTRMAAAAFLARYPDPSPRIRAMVEGALPPSVDALCLVTSDLWTPTVVRPTPKLCTAQVVFRDDCLVVVRTGSTDVTLPWCGAELTAGDQVHLALSAHGQPKLAVVTDRAGKLRVVDF
jgi:hypothetical protein